MLSEPKISYKPFWGICRPLNSWRANSPNPIQIYCAIFMVQERQQEIVNELLNYMDTLEDGSEVSTWDLMDEVFNYQRFNDGYCFNDFKISEEEFISLDSLLKESAMKEGFFIDDSIYQDVIGAFPFSLTFVVRK